MRWISILVVLLSGAPAMGQDAARPVVLDLAGLIALVAEPWRDGAGFEAGMSEQLPGLTILTDTTPEYVDDPWSWIRDGYFAAVPDLVPVGGYVVCSRYGLATRDYLADGDLTNRDAFTLFSLFRVEHDDAAFWPQDAVARVSCQITWDDTRAVSILPQAVVATDLNGAFDLVRDTMPMGQDAFYGAAGYHLTGSGGRRDTIVTLDRAVAVLTVRHQSLRIRSYLMNGGM